MSAQPHTHDDQVTAPAAAIESQRDDIAFGCLHDLVFASAFELCLIDHRNGGPVGRLCLDLPAEYIEITVVEVQEQSNGLMELTVENHRVGCPSIYAAHLARVIAATFGPRTFLEEDLQRALSYGRHPDTATSILHAAKPLYWLNVHLVLIAAIGLADGWWAPELETAVGDARTHPCTCGEGRN